MTAINADLAGPLSLLNRDFQSPLPPVYRGVDRDRGDQGARACGRPGRMRTFALGYVFALRRSELVTLDLDKQGTGEGVLRITAKTIEVTFAKSKTSSGKPQSVAVPRAENAEAVKAIEAWIELAGVRAWRAGPAPHPQGRQDRRPAAPAVRLQDREGAHQGSP